MCHKNSCSPNHSYTFTKQTLNSILSICTTLTHPWQFSPSSSLAVLVVKSVLKTTEIKTPRKWEEECTVAGHLGTMSVTRSVLEVSQRSRPVTVPFLPNGPERKSSDAGSPHMRKRSPKVRACISQSTVYTGFATTCGYRHPLEVLECVPDG